MKRLLMILVMAFVVGCAVGKEEQPFEPFISKLNWDKWDPEHKHCPTSIYDVKWHPTYMYDYLAGFGDLQITPEKLIWSYSGEFTYEYAGSKDGKDYFILDGIPLSPDEYMSGTRYISIEVKYYELLDDVDCYIERGFYETEPEYEKDITKWRGNRYGRYYPISI